MPRMLTCIKSYTDADGETHTAGVSRCVSEHEITRRDPGNWAALDPPDTREGARPGIRSAPPTTAEVADQVERRRAWLAELERDERRRGRSRSAEDQWWQRTLEMVAPDEGTAAERAELDEIEALFAEASPEARALAEINELGG